MKTEMSSLDLFFIINELKELEGSRFDKAYQNKREFMFQFHKKGKLMLKVLPSIVYLTEYKEEFPQNPPGFCKLIRKHLSGSFLRKIEQIKFERILTLDFEHKETNYQLIIELFAGGNVILTKEKKILGALQYANYTVRTIRGGIEYEFPPAQPDMPMLDKKEFELIFQDSDMESIVKKLAVKMGLGGYYAEMICELAGVDKNSQNIKGVFEATRKLLSKDISPEVVENEIIPFGKKTHQTFSEAIDFVFSRQKQSETKVKSEKLKQDNLKKIEEILKQQNYTINGMQKSMDENQEKGEYIYEHYEQIKQILADFNKARSKMTWEELKEKLKGSVVKDIKDKEGKITIELK